MNRWSPSVDPVRHCRLRVPGSEAAGVTGARARARALTASNRCRTTLGGTSKSLHRTSHGWSNRAGSSCVCSPRRKRPHAPRGRRHPRRQGSPCVCALALPRRHCRTAQPSRARSMAAR
eukprot:4024550-Prymnesium_polylepis.2